MKRSVQHKVKVGERLFGLEHLFGSRTRSKLLKQFLQQPQDRYFVRELTRLLKEHINSVRRELSHLEEFGLLKAQEEQRRKFYQVNTTFPLYPELRALVLKERLLTEQTFIRRLAKTGTILYFSLLGYFVDDNNSPIDIFIIGDIERKQLTHFLDQYASQFGHQLRYTLMAIEEYHYRRSVTDKFLFTILQGQQVVIVNKL